MEHQDHNHMIVDVLNPFGLELKDQVLEAKAGLSFFF